MENIGTEWIGKNLSKWMARKGVSRQALSDATGIWPDTIEGHMATGLMKTDALVKYARELGVSPAILLSHGDLTSEESWDEALKRIYPYNLAWAIIGCRTSEPDIKMVIGSMVPKALETLTDREQLVLKLRFKDKMTLNQVAEEIGRTRERIRQIEAKALRKLAHPSKVRMFMATDPIEAYENKKEIERLRCVLDSYGIEKLDHDLLMRDMGLSKRTYNCLARAGIIYVHELGEHTVEEYMKIRDFGAVCMEEIIEKAAAYGIRIMTDKQKEEFEQEKAREKESMNALDPQGTRPTLFALELSVRPHNCLTRAGIVFVDQLKGWTMKDLLKIRNLGVGSATEIVQKAARFGITIDVE